MGVQINGDTGNISATKADYSGNVTIGGTLTYEDVTNIDSVGLITAREGIEVGARPGVAASISVDGNMIVSGISTFGGDVQVPDKIIHSGDTNTAIRFPAADTVSVETGGSERVRIDSSGRMGIGDDSPDRELVVKHASSNSSIKIESANTHTSQILFADSDGEQVGRVAVFHGSGQVTSDSLTLDTAGTARVRVEPAGNVNVSQNLNVAGVCTATHFSSNSGTTIQRQFKYLTSTGQLAKGSTISELTTDLRIDFTPKFADSNLLMEFESSFVFPNSTNLQFCLFYDVTNSTGVSLPAASGSRVRCHWTNRTTPQDGNDNDHISMKIVTPANNTTARTYTIHFGTESAQAQFFASTLSSAGAGSTYPMTFIITEIAA